MTDNSTTETEEQSGRELAARIEDLEAQVRAQQEVLQKMMPSRRAVLRGGAAAGAVGLLGFGAGQATATPGDDGDTVWGSQSNRDDYWADEIDMNLGVIRYLNLGPTESKTISSGSITVSSAVTQVQGEGGGTDTLTDIAGGSDNDIILLTGYGGGAITVSHGSGNLRLDGGSDKTLSNAGDFLLLKNNGTVWHQIAFSTNS